MRLIHIKDMQMFVKPVVDGIVHRFEDFKDSPDLEEHVVASIEEQTGFAILSHRWSNDELTLQDVTKIHTFSEQGVRAFMKRSLPEEPSSAGVIKKVAELSEGQPRSEGQALFKNLKKLCKFIPRTSCPGFRKLVKFCKLAAAKPNSCRLAWMDTACIDKTSSAELEESVRSMFRWYRESRVCIVQLADSKYKGDMDHDSWFTRGWTLQELLAPTAIKFYDANWNALMPDRGNDKVSDKESGKPLWENISRITGISEKELFQFEPGMHDIRKRFGWASQRHTTRMEDMAYCLLGIFDISLPIAYGEGKVAFYRLQLEIMRRSDDKGLFMWNGEASPYNSMLAAGPECFSDDAVPVDIMPRTRLSTFNLTNQGLEIRLSLHDVPQELVYTLVGGEKVDMTLNGPDEFFKLGILGYSSSNPLVILLKGRKSGNSSSNAFIKLLRGRKRHSDIFCKRVPRSILGSLTKEQLPPVKPTIVVVE